MNSVHCRLAIRDESKELKKIGRGFQNRGAVARRNL